MPQVLPVNLQQVRVRTKNVVKLMKAEAFQRNYICKPFPQAGFIFWFEWNILFKKMDMRH